MVIKNAFAFYSEEFRSLIMMQLYRHIKMHVCIASILLWHNNKKKQNKWILICKRSKLRWNWKWSGIIFHFNFLSLFSLLMLCCCLFYAFSVSVAFKQFNLLHGFFPAEIHLIEMLRLFSSTFLLYYDLVAN